MLSVTDSQQKNKRVLKSSRTKYQLNKRRSNTVAHRGAIQRYTVSASKLPDVLRAKVVTNSKPLGDDAF